MRRQHKQAHAQEVIMDGFQDECKVNQNWDWLRKKSAKMHGQYQRCKTMDFECQVMDRKMGEGLCFYKNSLCESMLLDVLGMWSPTVTRPFGFSQLFVSQLNMIL